METLVLRLYAATLLAIKEHAENGEPFSARDITEYIEGKLADNDWELVGGSPLIKHDTIRQYVHEIMDNRLLELSGCNYRFVKSFPVNSRGDSYKQYSVVFDDDNEDNEEDFDTDDLFDKLGETDNRCCDVDGEKKVRVVVEGGMVDIFVG